MKKYSTFFGAVISIIAPFFLSGCQVKHEADICIYGGTSAGVIAAYSADKLGKSVILIEPGIHLGGLSSSGLGATDIGNKYAVTGLSHDFYRRLGKHYGKLESWTFEPHVAEDLFNEYIKESGIKVLMNNRLIKVRKQNNEITSIQIVRSQKSWPWTRKNVAARQFIDCSYEGDLMANAGISYIIGRESNSQYNETLNGVQLQDKHQFPDSIDPYTIPGKPESGLLWGINSESLQITGTGDNKLQAYNYRLCLTQDTTNMMRITPPRDYDPSRYELLKRVIDYRSKRKIRNDLGIYLSIIMMPNGKTDINNNGPFSTDYINENWNYPEFRYRQRKKFEKEQADYIKGLLYYLGNDTGVIPELRKQMLSWGYARDEFMDNGGFPHQMYMREARRMIGEYVMTEHNCRGKEVVNDPVGLAAYTMDSHNCQRLVVNAMVKNEGDVQVGGFPPYPISYRSLTPKREECTNLLVPVCLSATHIAYGSIRMEPVFMVLGQVCSLAASMVIDKDKPVQELNVEQLREKLLNDPRFDGTVPEIIVDNADTNYVSITGNWNASTNWMGQYKHDCLIYSGSSGKQSRVRFTPEIKMNDSYSVYYYCPYNFNPDKDWAINVPFRIKSADNDTIVTRNLRASANDWINLGSYKLTKGTEAFIEIIADTLTLPAPADALLLVPSGNL
jgi:hypothetical protein